MLATRAIYGMLTSRSGANVGAQRRVKQKRAICAGQPCFLPGFPARLAGVVGKQPLLTLQTTSAIQSSRGEGGRFLRPAAALTRLGRAASTSSPRRRRSTRAERAPLAARTPQAHSHNLTIDPAPRSTHANTHTLATHTLAHRALTALLFSFAQVRVAQPRAPRHPHWAQRTRHP